MCRALQLDAEIEKNQQRIQNAQQLMLDGQIEPSDYREIKNRFEKTVMELEKKKREISSLDFNLNEYMISALEIVENLPKYFTRADLKAKQQLIGSVCPEKLIFENKSYRTKRVNEVLALICSADKGFNGSKKKLAPIFGSQSNQVPETGFEPARRCQRYHLKVVRLPISPPGQLLRGCKYRAILPKKSAGKVMQDLIFSAQSGRWYPYPARNA